MYCYVMHFLTKYIKRVVGKDVLKKIKNKSTNIDVEEESSIPNHLIPDFIEIGKSVYKVF